MKYLDVIVIMVELSKDQKQPQNTQSAQELVAQEKEKQLQLEM